MFIQPKKFWLAGNASLYAATGYKGPGDIVASAVLWGSSARAYTAAFAAGGTAIMDLLDQAGANPITINILSTGFADVASINAWVTAHSVTTIKVTKVYDQTGHGNHFTQATLGNMPSLTMNAINGFPALTSTNAASSFLSTAGTITQAQPYTLTAVSERTGAFTTAQGIIGETSTGTVTMQYTASASTVGLAVGSGPTEAASDSAFHSIIGLSITSANQMIVDGLAGTAVSGTGTSIGNIMRICRSANGGSSMTGMLSEFGMWPSGFNSTNYAAMYANQHGISGYNGAF